MDRRGFLAIMAGPAFLPLASAPPPTRDHVSTTLLLDERPYVIRYLPQAPGDPPADARVLAEDGGPGVFILEPEDVSGRPPRRHPGDLRPILATVTAGFLTRQWGAGESSRCGLCKVGCTAWRGNNGNVFCSVELPTGVAPFSLAPADRPDLALFQTDFPWAHTERDA